MTGGQPDHQLGARRAHPHARRRDPRVRGRTRPGRAAMSVETITLGCRLNFAESETIARTAPPGEDWIVVNSCAVTNEAVRQTRQAIRRAHRERPDAQILVTGCAAELDPRRSRQCRALRASSEMPASSTPSRPMTSWRQRRAPGTRSKASSRSRPAATIAAPSARSGRRADRADRCLSKRSATRSRARSTAAPGRSSSPGVDITDYEGGLVCFANGCLLPSRGSSACACRRSTASRSMTLCSS